MSIRLLIPAVLLAASAGAAGYAFQTPAPQTSQTPPAPHAGVDQRPPNGATQTPAFAGQTDAPEAKKNVAFHVVTVAEGLDKPWGVAFLPSGKMVVTEKPGRLRIVAKDGTLSP